VEVKLAQIEGQA